MPNRRQDHKHAWQMVMHLDGCHYYTSSYRCRCGATAVTTHERDVTGFGAVWMEPQYREVRRDERGRFCPPRVEEVRCERCEALRAGEPPRRDLVVMAKNGTVEREEHGAEPS